MATIDLPSENFKPTVEQDGIVMVDCWASVIYYLSQFLNKWREPIALPPQDAVVFN